MMAVHLEPCGRPSYDSRGHVEPYSGAPLVVMGLWSHVEGFLWCHWTRGIKFRGFCRALGCMELSLEASVVPMGMWNNIWGLLWCPWICGAMSGGFFGGCGRVDPC